MSVARLPSSFRVVGSALLAFAAFGCSADQNHPTAAARAPLGAAPPAAAPADLAKLGPAAGWVPGAKSETRAEAKPVAAVQSRKIIYNAQVDMVVESIGTLGRELRRLNEEHGAFLSETQIDAAAELRRSAIWKIRVPVDQFEGYLAAVIKLGELKRNHVDSEDVTQEYYDLEARIKNKQEEEKRLLKHLADSTGKLDDILTVERELSRVRGEVEQMQGRIQFLASQSALSTITIRADEIHNYKPPETPTFRTEVARTFEGSVGRLVDLGKAIVIAAVAIAPWLPVLALVLLPVAVAARRRPRNRRLGVPPA